MMAALWLRELPVFGYAVGLVKELVVVMADSVVLTVDEAVVVVENLLSTAVLDP